jgi:hypothetical protein
MQTEFDPETALTEIRKTGWEVPEANIGGNLLGDWLRDLLPTLFDGDEAVVPDHEEEMLWRLFIENPRLAEPFGLLHNFPLTALREKWSGDGKEMIEGLAAYWEGLTSRKMQGRDEEIREVSAETAAHCIDDLLTGPNANAATVAVGQALAAHAESGRSSIPLLVSAWAQNAALLKSHGCSLRTYLASIAPETYLPAPEFVFAERLWHTSLLRDFAGMVPAAASCMIADWLLGLWRAGHIEWFESCPADPDLLNAAAKIGALPASAPDNFAAFCRTLRLPADWIPVRYWLVAFYNLPPYVVLMAIGRALNSSDGSAQGIAAMNRPTALPITDGAAWPHRTWWLPRYKGPAFLEWVADRGGLDVFRQSPAYSWAVARQLIVDDEWNESAEAFPGTVEDGEAKTAVNTLRLKGWIENYGSDVITTDRLERLEAILTEADYGIEIKPWIADPFVYMPFNGAAVVPIHGDQGQQILGVFSTSERFQQAHPVDGVDAKRCLLSIVCEIFADARESADPFDALVINPGQAGSVAVPPSLIHVLTERYDADGKLSYIEIPEEYRNSDYRSVDFFPRPTVYLPDAEFGEDFFRPWVLNPLHSTAYLLYDPSPSPSGYPLLHRVACPIVQAQATESPSPEETLAIIAFTLGPLFTWVISSEPTRCFLCPTCRPLVEWERATPRTPIEEITVALFANLDIPLTPEMLSGFRSGYINFKGWDMSFVLGENPEKGPFLATLSSHRMSGESHRRLYASGEIEDLPASGMTLFDPDLTEEEQQAADEEKEKEMMEQLRLSGFM